MDKNKIVIIFSGYNDRAVVSFIRTLEKNKIKYVVIAKNNADLIFKTAYKNNVVLTRETQCLDLDTIKKYLGVIQEKFKIEQYFIAPSTEALNRFLQKEREELEKINVIVPLSDKNVYTSISDKKVFGEICRENGIFVPDEYDSIENTIYPFVAKPRKYVAQNGSIYTPFLIFDSDQKKIFLKECDPRDFYFQKYIEGRSIYLLYCVQKNGGVLKFSQENLVQQPDGKSMIAAISSDFHNSDESMKYEQLFIRLGFYGLVMVEIKVFKDRNYMIEANPRFWGPSQLFIDAGINLFEVFLHDYNFITNTPVFQKPKITRYFWSGGVKSIHKVHKNLTFYNNYEGEFLSDLDLWAAYDVFNREDTIEIFKEEIL